ncbi:hypothetical protein IQ235_03945 [Oscillatoriales cyanobacterium LEGE 11467]|uniref:Uncharacterized protein n=1 Tax=Zarconia navalis LEGE 11467 TaxID=1828826 RepID=A0A928VUX7_9CYAN|nr:hypothetical protein [Zarconia navalis]MBE9039944.1 hypothetical protein [Zarconia navalis LEGE 11467]
MTQPSRPPERSPVQETFYNEIRPLLDEGRVSEEDLNIATSVIDTTDRNPKERSAMFRVWTAYVGRDNSQNTNKEAS